MKILSISLVLAFLFASPVCFAQKKIEKKPIEKTAPKIGSESSMNPLPKSMAPASADTFATFPNMPAAPEGPATIEIVPPPKPGENDAPPPPKPQPYQ